MIRRAVYSALGAIIPSVKRWPDNYHLFLDASRPPPPTIVYKVPRMKSGQSTKIVIHYANNNDWWDSAPIDVIIKHETAQTKEEPDAH